MSVTGESYSGQDDRMTAVLQRRAQALACIRSVAYEFDPDYAEGLTDRYTFEQTRSELFGHLHSAVLFRSVREHISENDDEPEIEREKYVVRSYLSHDIALQTVPLELWPRQEDASIPISACSLQFEQQYTMSSFGEFKAQQGLWFRAGKLIAPLTLDQLQYLITDRAVDSLQPNKIDAQAPLLSESEEEAIYAGAFDGLEARRVFSLFYAHATVAQLELIPESQQLKQMSNLVAGLFLPDRQD